MKKKIGNKRRFDSAEVWFKISKDERGYPKSKDWEGLWATRTVNGLYRIKSVPFYIRNVSYGDLVKAKRDSKGVLRFISVERRGNHSTYRILLSDDYEPKLKQVLAQLAKLGARAESAIGCLIAIDAPPYRRELIVGFIRDGYKKGYWDEDDGFIA